MTTTAVFYSPICKNQEFCSHCYLATTTIADTQKHKCTTSCQAV